MAAGFKFAGMSDTAGYIAAGRLSVPAAACLARRHLRGIALVLAFLTGAFFSEAALLAGIYVIFLAFAFHGPSHWEGNQAEFGFFVDHFTFLAGLALRGGPRSGRRAGDQEGSYLAALGALAAAELLRSWTFQKMNAR